MKKCILKINPAVLLGIFATGRSLLTVEYGVQPDRVRRIKSIAVNPNDGTIIISYEQQELITIPGDIPQQVNPQFSLVGVPDDIDTLISKLQEVATLCVEEFGAPKGQPFDIADYLREIVAPLHREQRERLN